ncbi:SDR family oxidoreductase [Dasania sp. GY-MA-18]|uniref:SDR family NAD(P)-dependent oxidoreductase n=1 Tax=Dasania phycosphaerae TaxID=2950436 RepID=A0A9J6RMT3_9GAMM|nr:MULTISPECIES: SDR family oxidoreductase [Dasania]MCR8922862.1 SDR family oxidoreductase [Dasania sp. GY-MA-18]MCZ0865293.1 SDR family NAD(P)-dependent oxidoreductase [Dasania phycosphaerae]MCZ0869018.1 SDR family NAD(P)-dependent oxidoreductase [Dasania phycosphaerae]
MSFQDKRVLITGGSRGIGLATAQELLERGAIVAINGRSAATVDEGYKALGGGDRVIKVIGDVATVAGCEAIVQQAVAAMGGLDVLVNAAGVGDQISIEDTTEAIWDATLDINLKGTFFCCRAALPALKASGGNIVNIASDSGLKGEPLLAAYCASKAAVVNMGRSMALDLAPSVRVNCVCPGYVDTDMVRRDYIDRAADPAAAEQQLIELAPLRRLAAPSEIAKAVAYLASDDAKNITGTALAIDGGTTAG